MNVFIPNNAIVCIDAMSPREAFMFENMFSCDLCEIVLLNDFGTFKCIYMGVIIY